MDDDDEHTAEDLTPIPSEEILDDMIVCRAIFTANI